MKLEHIDEPLLLFGSGTHVCPRHGIAAYGVYDRTSETRRGDVIIGAVGSAKCVESLEKWINRCKTEIPGAEGAAQPTLRTAFPGFSKSHGFDAELVHGTELRRTIKNSEIDEIIKIKERDARVTSAIDLYYDHVKFLAQNRPVDVIVCVIPDSLYKALAISEQVDIEETLEDTVEVSAELNFRRALKAKAMHLGKPLQLIRAHSLGSNTPGIQDDATKAWNFCSAIYYKAGARVPWKLVVDDTKPSSCAIGISFYRSRDRSVLNTSLAQIFDELGNGLILRGTPVDIGSDDRIPHLTSYQASQLITSALNEYRSALRTYPARIVVHKSSNFSKAEEEGILAAARALNIDSCDLVTVMDSRLKLLRPGNYPPYRGTLVEIDDDRHVLYSRGAVWYFKTYTGLYIPQPLELRIARSEESPSFIAREILGLTKMNWNNTQFDGKYPVTLGCSRKVGEIMKYLEDREVPQIRYGFYM